MSSVSNRFFVTAIKDGSTASAVMRCDSSLSQMYNPSSGACVPDWNAAASHPLVWVESDLGGRKKAPESSTSKWYYNGVEILFDANGMSTNFTQTVGGSTYPVFEKTTRTASQIDWPALRVLRNLASVGNTDQDVLSFEGSLEVSGSQLGFSVSTPVRLSQMSQSGWMGVLKGDQAITEKNGTATVTAELYNGGTQKTTFHTKWYDEGSGTLLGTANAANRTASFTINESSITDYVVLRCDFYESSSSNEVLYSMFWEIDDETDSEKMYIANSAGNNRNSAALRDGESVTFIAWMGTSSDQTAIDSRYTNWKCKIMDSTGSVVKEVKTPMAGKTPDASTGLFDITNSITVPGVNGSITGGSVTIDFATADEWGGTISGIITATN